MGSGAHIFFDRLAAMSAPDAVLITYEDNSKESAEKISTLVKEILHQPDISISIVKVDEKRDSSPVRAPTNKLGFMSESVALPTSLEEVDYYLRVCKHNRKLAKKLLGQDVKAKRRSPRISQKRRKVIE